MNKNKNLHWYILVSLLLAFCAGIYTKTEMTFLGFKFYDFYCFIGTMFLNGLKMLSIPLIVSSVISGISSMGTDQFIGKMGKRALTYYITTTALAVLVGIIFINIVKPGYGINIDQLHNQALTEASAKVHANFDASSASNQKQLANVFYQLLPNNIFQAAANGQLLGVIVFSLLFGYFILHSKEKSRVILTDFWKAAFETLMLCTMWFLKFTPIGVFGLVAKSVAETGFEAFIPLMEFFFTVIAALGFHSIIVLSLILYFIGGVNPWSNFKALSPALLTAFSTSSSSASLPVTLECVEKNAGVSNKVSSFVVPLGATLNLNGTALYEGMAAIFIAQAYGLHIGIDKQAIILFLALLTSIGVAGIPSASLVSITIILTTIGLPVESIGLLMITDRVLDMFRTAVNVYGDGSGAVLIAKSVGEKNVLSVKPIPI